MYRAKKDGPVLLGWRHPWEHWDSWGWLQCSKFAQVGVLDQVSQKRAPWCRAREIIKQHAWQISSDGGSNMDIFLHAADSNMLFELRFPPVRSVGPKHSCPLNNSRSYDGILTCSTWISFLFLKEIMWYSPRIPTFVRKELRTGHVEDLPSVKPHGCVILSVCLLQVRPNFLFALIHFG